jgi:hypothetical protein
LIGDALPPAPPSEVRARERRERPKAKGTRKSIILVPLGDVKFLNAHSATDAGTSIGDVELKRVSVGLNRQASSLGHRI